VKRISNLLRIVLVHAIWFSACVHAQTASSPIGSGPNEISTVVPHTGSAWINVASYGAKADGVADDTTAIDSAMTACTTGITLRSYVSMKGDGWGTSIIQLKPHTVSDVLTVPAGTFNFGIYGLTFDGNSARGGTGNCFSVAPGRPNGTLPTSEERQSTHKSGAM
jgi:hypothetical protein